jgi:hypothetical protein
LTTYASLLSPSKKITHSLARETVRGYIHNIMVSGYRPPTEPGKSTAGSNLVVSIGGETLELGEGDGAFIEVAKGTATAAPQLEIENKGSHTAEFLWFEMPM